MTKKENVSNIGARIKGLRKEKQITLSMLAEYSGLSIAYLSNLERSLTSPTLDQLQQICSSLGTSIYEMISEEQVETLLIRQNEALVKKYPEFNQSVTYYDFGMNSPLCQIITIQPGKVRDPQFSRHLYDENCTVLSGQMSVRLKDETILLNEGDSLYIKKNTSHFIYNEGDVPSVSYWVYNKN
ncbi:MAG: XRE family transcriptional regulator [Clostridiales bacterium]|nr:XRE family transcriptional regulator [Clostridiales bacterium]